jgi:hypothetical protein
VISPWWSYSLVSLRMRGGGLYVGEKESLKVRGLNISSAAAPGFIKTQLHAKSVICSNRERSAIGSLRSSVPDTLSLFQPQPKIIRRKEAKVKGHLSER